MRYLVYFSILCLASGLIASFIAIISPSYIDSEGFLHEPFAWEASGKLLILAGLCVAAIAGAGKLIKKFISR